MNGKFARDEAALEQDAREDSSAAAVNSERALSSSLFDKSCSNEKLVSILIPAYNEAEIIGSTLAHYSAMVDKDLEIVVVDDGSDDETASIAKSWAKTDSRISVYNITNSKRAGAINAGLARSHGVSVICTDADSLISYSTVERARELSEVGSEVAAITGQLIVGNMENWLTRCQAVEYALLNQARMIQSKKGSVSLIPGPIGIFRRDILVAMGGFSTKTYAEDADFTCQAIANGEHIAFDQSCSAWTEVPNNWTDLKKQRYRWVRGQLQAIKKPRSPSDSNRRLLNNAKRQLLATLIRPMFVSLSIWLSAVLTLGLLLLDQSAWGTGVLFVSTLIFELASQRHNSVASDGKNPGLPVLLYKILVFDSIRSWWAVLAIVDELCDTEMSWNKIARYNVLDAEHPAKP